MKQNLSEICEFIIDCEHKTAPLSIDGYPSIRTPNVGRGRLILDGVNRVDEATYRAWSKRAIPQPGDLIIAREAPVGNVAIIGQGQTVCLGQRTVLVRPDHAKVDAKYLTYLLLDDGVQSAFRAASSGATVAHLNLKDIRGLQLPPLPPMVVQRRIGATLSTYDELIENNTRRIAILEEMARRIFEEWFVRFRAPGCEGLPLVESELGPIPKGWRIKHLGDILDLKYGKALKADTRVQGQYPVYGSSGVVGTHTEALVTGPGIIVGRKGNVGSVHWSQISFFPIDTVFYVTSGLPLAYVFMLLRRQRFLNSDAAVPGLNRAQALAIEFQMSSPELIARFADVVEPFFRLGRSLADQNVNLRAQRDLLLPKLISGEIDVHEAAALPQAAE